MKKNLNQLFAGMFALLLVSVATTGGRFEQLEDLLGSYQAGIFLFGVAGTWFAIGKIFDALIGKQSFGTVLITLLCGGIWGLEFVGISVYLIPLIVAGVFVAILWLFKSEDSREDKAIYSGILCLLIYLFVGMGCGFGWLGELNEAEKESSISFTQPVQLREGDTLRAVVVDGKLRILEVLSETTNIAGIPTQKGTLLLK